MKECIECGADLVDAAAITVFVNLGFPPGGGMEQFQPTPFVMCLNDGGSGGNTISADRLKELMEDA